MIDDVRNTVLAIANKNNYGYVGPQDFNLYCQQAQMDMFEDYFYQYNNWINQQNKRISGTGYADIVKGLEEVIDSFSSEVFLTQVGVANTYTLPTDYYLINKLFYYPNSIATGTNTFVAAFKLTDATASFSNLTNPNTPPVGSIIINTTTTSQCYVTAVDNSTTLSISANIMNLNDTYIIYTNTNITEVERLSQNKIFYLTSSPLTAPTTQFPAYVLNGNTVTIYPSTILEATSIQSQYIRYPLTPKWTYSQLTGGQPEFNPAQADYQDFELPLSDEPTLVAKICSYIGIEIRESDVYDFGQQELRDETQQTS
tara:strand:+ start:3932 stop:4870 length:939 start_codon:yes stop_codon:yes gene_type:complete